MIEFSGYLLRLLTDGKDENYENMTHLILDEVHEREIYTELLMIAIKKVIKKQRKIKLIIMSATLDAEQFSAFFYGCNIINVPGRLFHVQLYHLDEVLAITGYNSDSMINYMNSNQCSETVAYQATKNGDEINFDLLNNVICHIHNQTESNGSILVFLPGYQEIMQLYELLKESIVEEQEPYKLFILHSNVEEDDVFSAMPEGTRKIILSTNIAETSVTIDDVVRN